MRIVIAVTNRHKLAEYQQLFASHRVVSLLDFPGVPDVTETADTFEGNAALKADAISKLLGVTVIADRSAYYVTVIAVSSPGQETRFARGELQGRIAETESQVPGFAYDTLFVPDGHDRPLSELSNKNDFSHRRIAAEKAEAVENKATIATPRWCRFFDRSHLLQSSVANHLPRLFKLTSLPGRFL